MTVHLYFAYGMNTNISGMKIRCPRARSLGAAMLPNYRFRFSGPADVVSDPSRDTDGVLWELTDECLAALDRLEGYPTYYTRFIVKVLHNGDFVDAWVYQMTPGHLDSAPSDSYWDCLTEGYRDHGVSTIQMLLARERAYAWEDCEDHYQVGTSYTSISSVVNKQHWPDNYYSSYDEVDNKWRF
jgi:gamma-glutamylcyclotransferase (GGCT)/AIG2-like uncharacterized protein YtfP